MGPRMPGAGDRLSGGSDHERSLADDVFSILSHEIQCKRVARMEYRWKTVRLLECSLGPIKRGAGRRELTASGEAARSLRINTRDHGIASAPQHAPRGPPGRGVCRTPAQSPPLCGPSVHTHTSGMRLRLRLPHFQGLQRRFSFF